MKTTKAGRAEIRAREAKSFKVWESRECQFKYDAQDTLDLLDDVEELIAEVARAEKRVAHLEEQWRALIGEKP